MPDYVRGKIMKMFSYPQDSILRKTLLYLVDISESYYDYLISEF